MDMMSVLMAVITSSVLGTLAWIVRFASKSMQNHANDHTLLKSANLFQIKATLLFMYRRCKDSEQITSQELEVFNDLFEIYHKLGGNGTMETIHTKINDFEIID